MATAIQQEFDGYQYVPITVCFAVLDLITPEQRRTVINTLRDWKARNMRLSIDHSLPDGYIGFVIEVPGPDHSTKHIFGGISPDGSVST